MESRLLKRKINCFEEFVYVEIEMSLLQWLNLSSSIVVVNSNSDIFNEFGFYLTFNIIHNNPAIAVIE